MRRAVREELNRIEKFLLRGDKAAEDLAALLSALRGPDNCDGTDKAKYTAPIRGEMFPLLAAGARKIAGAMFGTGASGWQIGGELPAIEDVYGESHYHVHVYAALKAARAIDE